MMENPRPTKQHSPDAASVLAPALKFGAVTGMFNHPTAYRRYSRVHPYVKMKGPSMFMLVWMD